jgi:GH35 family endo-1,4-beta-xylanase
MNSFPLPNLDAHVEAGIREHRMSKAVVRITDRVGRPMPETSVTIEQVSSDFLFGANIFMLNGYPSDDLNARYEKAFTRLFNAATVPFYWRDLEPEQGQLRFSANSLPIPRRPPPDMVVAFCEKHGLNMNGHCLVWDYRPYSIPMWLKNTETCEHLLERRIRQIAERYGERIPRWDVLNEALSKRNIPGNWSEICPMPKDYERLAFELAARFLPKSAHLMINETTPTSWFPQYRPSFLEQIARLLDDGAKIDGIGLQWHLFSNEEVRQVLAGEMLQPEEMLHALDAYRQLGLPVHISEITLPAVNHEPDGEEMQARMVRYFYRLWFSHPAVHAITWWNVPDGGAATSEIGIASGLLNSDLSPKPAYEALRQLITEEWRTNLTVVTDVNGEACFHGFHGSYRLRLNGQQKTFELCPASSTFSFAF